MVPDDPEDVLEELASLPTFHHATASPDGTEVALYYDGSGRNELHVLDVETGEHRQVSDGEVPRNARWWVQWGPDGEDVYFHLDEAGNEQNDVHVIDREGNAEPILEQEGQVMLTGVADDGTLYYGASTEGQMNVYRKAPGEDARKLTDYERAVWGCELSPDGERIAYSTNESDDYDNQDVYVADADGSNSRNLEVGEVGAEAGPADWAPDGQRLLVSDNSPDLNRAGIYDLETDEVRWLGADTDGANYEENPVAFVRDGDAAVVVRSRDAARIPVVYDPESGEGRELDVPVGVTTPAGSQGPGEPTLTDGRLLLTHTTPDRRPELLSYDLDADEYEVLFDAEYGPFSPEDFADAEYVQFQSDGVPETRQAAVEHGPYDELEIGALLYDSGERPSPLVVNPHGGPRAADTRSFGLYTQFLVQRGYSVLQVNYRGSTGRGREFVRELHHDWGGAEQGDVASAVEHVLETREWLDEDRVAVFGGSYGGYSAYWQVVQYPELYDAGIAWIGLTDLEEMYETTMPHFRTELMDKSLGSIEEFPELYRERSPIEHAANLSTPLLMIHGVNDRRVPVSQARLFRDRLEELGYEEGEAFEYRELGEEGHASSDIDQKIRMFRTLDDFLGRRMPVTADVAGD